MSWRSWSSPGMASCFARPLAWIRAPFRGHSDAAHVRTLFRIVGDVVLCDDCHAGVDVRCFVLLALDLSQKVLNGDTAHRSWPLDNKAADHAFPHRFKRVGTVVEAVPLNLALAAFELLLLEHLLH